MSSATTCKFFLQGNCRFGGRCRFYHPRRGQQGGGSSRHQAPPSHDRSDSSWNGRNQNARNQFSLYSERNDGSDYDGNGRRGRGDQFQNLDQQGGRQDRYHYTNPNYSSSHHRNQGDKDEGWRGGGRGGGRAGRGRGESMGGRGEREGEWRESGGGREGEWQGGGRREGEWQGGGRREGEWQGGGRREGEWQGGGRREGEWQGGGRREGEGRGGGGGREWRDGGRREDRRSDDNYGDSYSSSSSATGSHQELATSFTKDMKNWKTSSMWPLSCYGNLHHVPYLPGLVDVSPEEMRFEAYKANSSGTSAQFLKNVEELCSQQVALISKYADLTLEDVKQLEKLSPGNDNSGLFGSLTKPGLFHSPSPASSASTFANTSTNCSLFGEPKFSLSQTENKSTGTSLFASSPVPQMNTLAPRNLFSSPASAMWNSSSSSSQEVPLLSAATTGTKPDEDTSELTEEALQAFKADVFVFKQIPECLPPLYLC